MFLQRLLLGRIKPHRKYQAILSLHYPQAQLLIHQQTTYISLKAIPSFALD